LNPSRFKALAADVGINRKVSSIFAARCAAGGDHLRDGWFAEFGDAFNRRIEYESTSTEIDLSDGILLQAG
jgi:hypothetical protein